MRSKIERARDAVVALLDASNPQNEFFLTTFADKPTLIQDFTKRPENIESYWCLQFQKDEHHFSMQSFSPQIIRKGRDIAGRLS